MLIGATSDVSGDASIERTVRPVRHDIDPTAAHPSDATRSSPCVQGVDGRDKPGHDIRSLRQEASTKGNAIRKPSQNFGYVNMRWLLGALVATLVLWAQGAACGDTLSPL